jgi:hypothetical protein
MRPAQHSESSAGAGMRATRAALRKTKSLSRGPCVDHTTPASTINQWTCSAPNKRYEHERTVLMVRHCDARACISIVDRSAKASPPVIGRAVDQRHVARAAHLYIGASELFQFPTIVPATKPSSILKGRERRAIHVVQAPVWSNSTTPSNCPCGGPLPPATINSTSPDTTDRSYLVCTLTQAK